VHKLATVALTLAAGSSLAALEESPWFDDLYQFRSVSDFFYSYFDHVSDAKKPLGHSYNTYLFHTDAGFTAAENIDVDVDLELVQTFGQNFSFRSSALQARYRFLDDIAGDPITVVSGLSLRGVGARSVRNISTPYASYGNAEVFVCLGKERSYKETWDLRGYFFTALGAATKSYPWIRAVGQIEKNFSDRQRLGLRTEGYFALAGKDKVDVDHFRGWGKIFHQSIDLFAFYGYTFGLYGELSVGYGTRVLALRYPSWQQTGFIRYSIPFSLL
jgi:hypothetical protein